MYNHTMKIHLFSVECSETPWKFQNNLAWQTVEMRRCLVSVQNNKTVELRWCFVWVCRSKNLREGSQPEMPVVLQNRSQTIQRIYHSVGARDGVCNKCWSLLGDVSWTWVEELPYICAIKYQKTKNSFRTLWGAMCSTGRLESCEEFKLAYCIFILRNS